MIFKKSLLLLTLRILRRNQQRNDLTTGTTCKRKKVKLNKTKFNVKQSTKWKNSEWHSDLINFSKVIAYSIKILYGSKVRKALKKCFKTKIWNDQKLLPHVQ